MLAATLEEFLLGRRPEHAYASPLALRGEGMPPDRRTIPLASSPRPAPMSLKPPVAPLAALALLLAPAAALAHFPFLSLDDGGDELRLNFGEEPGEESERMLPVLAKATVTRHAPDGTTGTVTFAPDGGALAADVAADPPGTVYTLRMPYGVTEGHGAPGKYLLDYSAAAMKEAAPADTGRPAAINTQPLAVVPEPGLLKVLAAGVPVAGAEVNFPGSTRAAATSAADGTVPFAPDPLGDGRVVVRASVVVPGAGVYEGEPFPETRRHATAVLTPADFQDAAPAVGAADTRGGGTITVEPVAGADLPEGVTSLGAAVSGGFVYYYGGHPGRAHHYSKDEQSNKFRRLDLADPSAGWVELPSGPTLQGLALVAHPAGGVLRIGGFTARNAVEDEPDLHSVPTVSHYDPAAGEWKDLTPLPGGRSSFDAAVLNGKVYVLGGWMMAGEEGEAWHGTGLVADLAADELEWELLPTPPQPRRAVSVAAVPDAGEAGLIYLIGGMLPEGEITSRVDIYDPAQKTWTRGPDLPGGEMDGFGTAAWGAGEAVYATTLTGKVLRLRTGAASWDVLGELENARFFHRLLPDPASPTSAPAFLLLGGSNMETGRFTAVERLTVGG